MSDHNQKQNQLRLMAVLAHPDDETFGLGGTLALYSRQGVETHLVCATRGEAGEIEQEYLNGYTDKGALREAELRCAAELLGLSKVYFMDYCDSGYVGSAVNQNPTALINAPLDEVVANIVCYIREVRPQVVITFDPIGGYRHPDHIYIHQAAVKAFFAAGDPDQYPGVGTPYQPDKLYFHVISHSFIRAAVKVMPIFRIDPRHYGRNKDIDLMSLVEVKFPIHARVDYRPVAKIREEASACHASQEGQKMTKGLYGLFRRVFSSTDQYMRAYPEPAKGVIENDLFEGVRGGD